jgi:hypothetical protein
MKRSLGLTDAEMTDVTVFDDVCFPFHSHLPPLSISGRSELLQVDRYLLFKNMTAGEAQPLAETGR